MNELTILEPAPQPSTPEPQVSESEHRGNGKIARLPKVLRDQVNRMLDDGVPYKAIIEKLEQSADPPLPYKLLEINVSRWKDNGYQHYLRHQEWRDDLRILRESGSEMTEFGESPKFQETLVQIALTEIFRVLQQRELKSDSLNFIRLFNALARLNREALGLKKYNDLVAKEQAELKKLDIDRDISKNEHRAIVDRADRIFQMPRPRPDEDPSAHGAENLKPVSQPRKETHEANQPLQNSLSPSDGERARVRGSVHSPAHIRSSVPPTSLLRPPGPCSPSSPSHPALRSACDEEESRNTEHATRAVEPASSIEPPAFVPSPTENQIGRTSLVSKIENCLECRSPLPPVPPHSLRRPEDHCPSCGIRLPDIGLCYQPGFDKCLTCGATQPHLLPGGERPRPYCHKCGIRLHNPEPTQT